MLRLERDGPASARLPRLLECLAPAPVPLALPLARREVPTGLNPEVASALGSLPGDPVAVGDAVAALGRSPTQATVRPYVYTPAAPTVIARRCRIRRVAAYGAFG